MNESGKKWAFWALAGAFTVNFLGYAFIVPLLPSWKAQFLLSNTQVTALVSLWAVPLFLLGPQTGRITDRFGPGKTILTSLVLLTMSALLYLVATEDLGYDGFMVLALARLVHGASGAAIMTAGFAAASSIWPQNFGEMTGKLVAFATIGGLLGPVVGGVTYAYGPSFAFITLAGLTAAMIPLIYVTTKELGEGNQPAQGSVPLKVFIQNPILLRIGLLIVLATMATGALEAGIPLFLAESLKLGPAWIGGVLLVMVLAQGMGGWIWGAKVDRKGPVRYMKLGWTVVTIALIGAGLVAHYVSDVVLAAYFIMIILGAFQFTIAAAQIPMLPMIDTATTNAYGEGSAGLAFGAFGTAWATGTIIGPLIIGPMYDATNSWGLTIGVLAIPMVFGLLLTLKNQEMLTECYNAEMGKRSESE